MGLRELKKEISRLTDVSADAREFKKNWIKPIKRGQKGNKVQLQLNELDVEMQSHVNHSLKEFYLEFNLLEEHKVFTDKLHGMSHAMIEMKLLSLRGAENSSKMNFLQNTLLEDPQLSVTSLIKEVQNFDMKLNNIETIYHDINGYLHKRLSLEHSIALMELPHYIYLKNLKETAKNQKRIVKKLGHEFVSIQRKLKLQKKKQNRASD